MTSQHAISVLYCDQRFGARYSRFCGELLFQRLFSMFGLSSSLEAGQSCVACPERVLFSACCASVFAQCPREALPARGAFEISFYLALAD
jgi:hypothetical protein